MSEPTPLTVEELTAIKSGFNFRSIGSQWQVYHRRSLEHLCFCANFHDAVFVVGQLNRQLATIDALTERAETAEAEIGLSRQAPMYAELQRVYELMHYHANQSRFFELEKNQALAWFESAVAERDEALKRATAAEDDAAEMVGKYHLYAELHEKAQRERDGWRDRAIFAEEAEDELEKERDEARAEVERLKGEDGKAAVIAWLRGMVEGSVRVPEHCHRVPFLAMWTLADSLEYTPEQLEVVTAERRAEMDARVNAMIDAENAKVNPGITSEIALHEAPLGLPAGSLTHDANGNPITEEQALRMAAIVTERVQSLGYPTYEAWRNDPATNRRPTDVKRYEEG